MVFTVRNKACWELIKSSSNEGPSRRTGHTCITYEERIIMFAMFANSSKHLTEYVIGSAERILITITMIPGLLIQTRGSGQSLTALVLSRRHGKVMLLPLSMM